MQYEVIMATRGSLAGLEIGTIPACDGYGKISSREQPSQPSKGRLCTARIFPLYLCPSLMGVPEETYVIMSSRHGSHDPRYTNVDWGEIWDAVHIIIGAKHKLSMFHILACTRHLDL
jgi:hypothetical protein